MQYTFCCRCVALFLSSLLRQLTPQIPDHAAEHDAIRPNPNTRCTGWQFIELPINPGKVRRVGVLDGV